MNREVVLFLYKYADMMNIPLPSPTITTPAPSPLPSKDKKLKAIKPIATDNTKLAKVKTKKTLHQLFVEKDRPKGSSPYDAAPGYYDRFTKPLGPMSVDQGGLSKDFGYGAGGVQGDFMSAFEPGLG
jgi:hypothetical protein